MRSSCIVLLLAGLIALLIESSDSASLGQRNNELGELRLPGEMVKWYRRSKDVRENGDGNGENGPGDEGEEGESPADQSAGEAGFEPKDTDQEGSSDPLQDDISKNLVEFLLRCKENVLEKVYDIIDLLEGKNLLEAKLKVDYLLTVLDMVSKDANKFVGYLDTVLRHLRDGKKSLDDIDLAFYLAKHKISIGEDRKPLGSEVGVESERQAKGVGIPVTRAVGVWPLEVAEVGVESERQAKGVGIPVTRAVGVWPLEVAEVGVESERHAKGVGVPVTRIVGVGHVEVAEVGVESERQAKSEVGLPVARAVGGGPVEVADVGEESERQAKNVGIPVARPVGGGPEEVGVPVARAVGDGSIDKKAQLLREIRLLNFLQMLKDATKK